MTRVQHLERKVRLLTAALRKLALVRHVRLASGGGTVPNGWSCRLCGASCDLGYKLRHADNCLLRDVPQRR